MLLIFVFTGFISCKKPVAIKPINKLELAHKYYQALNTADSDVLDSLLMDSLVTIEADYDYTQTFTKEEYINNWLQWDAVFKPSYKVLKIEESQDNVIAEITKSDVRISLLHEGPTTWRSILRFKENKLVSIENNNVVFNDSIWMKNRTQLIDWIAQNHPELNGFLNGQNKTVGLKYLKAIELYNNKD